MTVRKLLNLIHLLRLELLLTAVSDAWLMIFLAYAIEPIDFISPTLTQMPLALALILGGIVATGLAAYGLALNDVLDARHDRAFSPARPIPAGRIRLTTAMSTAVIALLLALSAALFLGRGSALLAALVAGGILFYNTAARFLPATGILCLALLRMLHMFIVNPEATFVWPVWLNFSYTVATAATVYVLVAKRPRLMSHGWWTLLAGWTFWTLALVGWMSWRELPAHHAPASIWFGPIAALAIFLTLAVSLRSHAATEARRRRAVAINFSKLALLWLILLNASWLLAAGLYAQGAAHLALFAIGLAASWMLRAHEPQAAPSPAHRLRMGMGR